MHVIATAGHVDHGKSTLVRALTGTDPDRLEEERRRGLTISLGYCWTDLPGVGEVAFVDVPGHERFLATMLSGVGPVPAVLFVVAADDGWMPQAAEHLAALDAFGVRHGIIAVTRSDLTDPTPAAERAAAEFARTTLAGAPVVPVSGSTGQGLPELRDALTDLVAALPEPDPAADVRLWVDRCFTVRGAGTVVTGTLPAGTIALGNHLAVGDDLVRVRGIEALGLTREEVRGVARVALNLGSKVPATLRRDSVLVSPDAWHWTTSADVLLSPGAGPERVSAGTGLGRKSLKAGPRRVPPGAGPGRAELMLHIGAVAEHLHFRALGDTHGRLLLQRPLPLRVGDRAILRDPGSRHLWGAVVVDPAPPPLNRRGAVQHRLIDLKDADGTPDSEVRRRVVTRVSFLRRIGVNPNHANAIRAGDWLLDPGQAAVLRNRLVDLLAARTREHPLDPGLPLPSAAELLGLPSADLVAPLAESPPLPAGGSVWAGDSRTPLRLQDGRVIAGDGGLPPDVLEAVDKLRDRLREQPYRAPDTEDLQAVGLNRRALAAAERSGLLLRLTDSVVLLPGADEAAARLLAGLPQPFTISAARRCLDSTRRVVVPLLERLDRLGLTRRLPDDRREVLPM